MAEILLPTTIEFYDDERPNVGRMVITPCRQGYGTTLGNALRRVLLSSLPGAAVESIKIDGVSHEFAAVPGVLEDMIQIILNIKKMAVLVHSEESVKLTLTKKGVGPVTAADFDKNSDVEIVNPDLVIMNITEAKKEISMEVIVARGRGYIPVAEKITKQLDLGTIAVDSLYTPIRDVGYDVELTRVGDVTDYERLTMTIETNGTITPKAAVAQATKIIMDHFSLITDVTGNSDTLVASEESVSEEPAESKKTRKKKSE